MRTPSFEVFAFTGVQPRSALARIISIGLILPRPIALQKAAADFVAENGTVAAGTACGARAEPCSSQALPPAYTSGETGMVSPRPALLPLLLLLLLLLEPAGAGAGVPWPQGSPSQLRYLDNELSMFMHYSICTYNDGCDGGHAVTCDG